MNKEAEAYRRLVDIGLALSSEKDLDSLLERILVEAKTLGNADAGTLYLVTPANKLAFAIVLNDSLNICQGGKTGDPVSLPEMPLFSEESEPNMANIATRAAILKETIRLDDVYCSDGIDVSGAKKFDEITGYRSQSFLTVPLKNFSDETIGVLQLINAKDDDGHVIPFSEDVVPLIEALASQASVSLENRHLIDEQAELRKQLEHEVDERTEELKNALAKLSEAHIILKELTTIDAVTGIRNRQYFDDVYDQEWRRAVRQQYPITLMLLDIDHFKQVNDTYGHLAGDETLSTVAKAIEAQFHRPSDVVARFGGEEFVLILPYIELENARLLAEQVREYIANMEIHADGHKIGVTISIGVASVIPPSTMAARELIVLADKALYKAKSDGRNRVCVSKPGEDC